MADYYSVLGCDQDASKQQIRQQYKKLALQLHPDKNAEESGNKAGVDFDLIAKAASTLTDEKEKHKYDTSLLAKRSCNKIVNDEVPVDEFAFDQDDKLYYYECRCGGQFVLHQEFLDGQPASPSLVDCNCCSLSILVTR